MDRKYIWPDVPRFSRQDGEALALRHLNDSLTDKVTFGDIWKERETFTLLPMEEGFVKHWHWGRIAVLGDAAHKVNLRHTTYRNNQQEAADRSSGSCESGAGRQ